MHKLSWVHPKDLSIIERNKLGRGENETGKDQQPVDELH